MHRLSIVCFLAASLFFHADSRISAEGKPSKDILATAATAGQFKTLADALTKAELIETLKGKGPITIFAPTDKAFAKVPKKDFDALMADKERLKNLLMDHVIVGKEVKSADVLKMDGKQINGFTIDAKDGIKIGDGKVMKADIATTNGVIHVIDAVLIPSSSKKN